MHIPNFIEILIILLAYAIGSIPVGYVLAKLFKHVDIRALGSGGIGATNVLRNTNKSIALLTLILDILKGYLAVSIGLQFRMQLPCAALVVLGHMYPLWLKFKGGKGVSTYVGVLLALSLPLGLQAVMAWVAFAFLFHYASLASILAALLIPLTVWLWNYENLLYLCTFLSTLIIIKHCANILRLFKGKEPKIGKK